jgi:hypothetical protein
MSRVAMRAFIATVAIALTAQLATFAADPRNPDWPCNQIKVPELSVAALWAGPPIDDVRDAWQNDPQIQDLVPRLAARRTPLDEAEKTIADFLAADATRRSERGKLLFAGLFATLNQERGTVMTGIDRFVQRQKDFADSIRAKARQLRELQDAPNHDQAKVDELVESINWDTRVFEEKRTTIRYVCDVPVTIERRLGALSRAIQQALE